MSSGQDCGLGDGRGRVPGWGRRTPDQGAAGAGTWAIPPSLLQVMAGYLNNPEATAQTVRQGWLHTGDIARYSVVQLPAFMVGQGGRGRLLLHGGQAEGADQGEGPPGDVLDSLRAAPPLPEVAPAELEDLLRELPGVADCAVLGVHDDRAGQVERRTCHRNEVS